MRFFLNVFDQAFVNTGHHFNPRGETAAPKTARQGPQG
jgi:hypothetical protein